MKTASKFLKSTQFLTVLLITCMHIAYAQDSVKDSKSEKAAAIKEMINAKNFTFIAQSALPTSGRMRQLTSYYDLKVSKDTIISDLPYYGRAYTAPINPSEGGIHFTSTNFEYTTTERKKGGWDVLVKPKDQTDVQQLLLNIFENGYASLQVTSTNRQVISFNGYVTEKKRK